MSLFQTETASASDGYARKFSSIQLPEANPHTRHKAIAQLRQFFLPRADVADKNVILSTLESQLRDPKADAGGEIVQGSFTRTQRKVARRLGFDVRHVALG